MPQHVLLTPPELADAFISSLREAGARARKRGRVVVVDHGAADGEPEARLELTFFLRAWGRAHPDLAFEFVDRDVEPR